MKIRQGQTVWVPMIHCVYEFDEGHAQSIFVDSDRAEPPHEAQVVTHAPRWWVKKAIDRQKKHCSRVAIFKSRRKAERFLKLQGIKIV